MYEDDFPMRLANLRSKKGVSAREMSLSIGQNAAYINNIETGKSLPSLSAFFFICDYLDITPQDFFDMDSKHPTELRKLIQNLKRLNPEHFHSIASIVEGLVKNT